MVPILNEIGKAVISNQAFEEPLKHFGEVARCETEKKRATVFRKPGPPNPNEESAFRDLVKNVEQR